MPLYAYRDNTCDPRKCTMKKLAQRNLVTIVTSIRRIPRSTLLLDPTAEQAVSPADRHLPSITALDCSWEVLDTGAAGRRRAGRPAPTGHFHFGPEREGYERQWTPDAYDFLTRTLDGLPIHWRFFAKTEIFSRMAGRTGAEGVEGALEEVYARFPEMPRSKAMIREAAE